MHGGSRPGAGRKKGKPNKVVAVRRQANREAVDAAKAAGETPLEYMLNVMRTSDDDKRRDAMAIAAAPFIHPRLSSIEGKLDVNLHEEALKELE